MLANVLSYGLMGLEGYPVTVEVDASGGGMSYFEIVGDDSLSKGPLSWALIFVVTLLMSSRRV